MARGDGWKQIFGGKEDYESFLHWLQRVCRSHGWRVHTWVLMGNHFHFLLETPEPNLSAGMRVLLGTYSQAWNSRHQRRGHVFEGRYRAVPVAGERAEDTHYFKSVADYIHLNPARAGLTGGRWGGLVDYPRSSLQPETLSERQCPGLAADGPGAGSLPAESGPAWAGSLCFLAGGACGKRGWKDRREGDGGDSGRLISRGGGL